MSWLSAFIEHPVRPSPQQQLYACPLHNYKPQPCPTPFQRFCAAPECRTHGIVMLPVKPDGRR